MDLEDTNILENNGHIMKQSSLFSTQKLPLPFTDLACLSTPDNQSIKLANSDFTDMFSNKKRDNLLFTYNGFGNGLGNGTFNLKLDNSDMSEHEVNTPSNKKTKLRHKNDEFKPYNSTPSNYVKYISECFKKQYSQSIDFIKLIGRGTYADVYKVKVDCTNYALKVFRNKGEKKDILQVKKELDIMNHLSSHPCILEYVNYITLPKLNIVSIIMPLMSHNLNDLVENRFLWSNFDECKIIDIMYKILCGVRYMHKSRIIHRDLKPSNILIDLNQKNVKIADFGLSGLSNDNEELIQSQSYRAPEIVLDEFHNYDSSIDIWSVGLIFCFLATTRHIIIRQDKQKIPSNILIEMIINLIGFDNKGDLEFVRNIRNSMARIYTEKYIDSLKNTDFKKGIDNIFQEDNQLKELINNMLFLNPKIRISAENAIQHIYFNTFRSNISESLKQEFERTVPTLYIDNFN